MTLDQDRLREIDKGRVEKGQNCKCGHPVELHRGNPSNDKRWHESGYKQGSCAVKGCTCDKVTLS